MLSRPEVEVLLTLQLQRHLQRQLSLRQLFQQRDQQTGLPLQRSLVALPCQPDPNRQFTTVNRKVIHVNIFLLPSCSRYLLYYRLGSGNSSSSVTGRRVTHHQAPTSSMRVPSASSSSNSLSSSSRPPVHSSSSGIGSGSVGSIVRSRSHGTNGASGTSGTSAGAPSGLLRKPARPQTSHPPPPPSSH